MKNSQATIECCIADIHMEEGKLNTALFPPEEANPSILFIHIVLCSSTLNHVCA